MPTSGGTHGGADQLSTYIRDFLAEHDLSERQLADRSKDPETGFGLNNGYINSLIRGRASKAPELWRLRALAAGMRVPASLLAKLAAAQWLGVEVAEIATGEADWVAVSIPEDMSPEERERFVRMAEDIARHMKT